MSYIHIVGSVTMLCYSLGQLILSESLRSVAASGREGHGSTSARYCNL